LPRVLRSGMLRAVRRLGIVLGLVAALLPLSLRPAWAACECVGASSSPRDQARDARVVFTGVVTTITTPSPSSQDVQVSFLVQEVYKGGSGSTITVSTPLARGACHFDFLPRVRYTVFADEHLSTGACSGNIRGAINANGYGLAPTPVARGSGPFRLEPAGVSTVVWVAAAAGVVVLVAGGIGLVAGRRPERPPVS
jgi:hypothetical protein